MAQWSLFSDTPVASNIDDSSSVNLGTEFEPQQPVLLKAIRFYNGTGPWNSTDDREAAIYQVIDGSSGTLLYGPVTISAPAQGSWGYYWLPTPITLNQGVRYRVVVWHPWGMYPATGHYFTAGVGWTIGPLWLPAASNATGNLQGSYNYNGMILYTTSSFNNTAYYSDIVVDDDLGGGATVQLRQSGAWVEKSTKQRIAGVWQDKDITVK